MADFIEAKSNVLAIMLCICFALSSLAVAAHRLFWYDEILTLSAARAPTTSALLAVFRGGSDQTPPLNAFIVRFFGALFGWTELAARLPSTLFAAAGLFIMFCRVRDLTNRLVGLTAMSILLLTFLPMWAYEARPYALLFFASVLALSLWTLAPDVSSGIAGKRRSMLFGFAMMLAVFAHYYGVLLILPFIAEEAKSRGMRKLFSFRLSCGMAGVGLAVAIQLPFIRAASRRRLLPFAGIPSWHALEATYAEMLMQVLFVLLCVILLFAWTNARTSEPVEKPIPAERLGWFFLGIPLAGFVLGEFVTHAYWPRYFIPLLAGFGLAFGCSLYRYFRNSPRVPLSILLIAVPVFLETALSHIRYARTSVITSRAEESDPAIEMLPQFRLEGKLFVLVPTVRSYLEVRYYAADPQMIRALLRTDRPVLPWAQDPLGIRYFSLEDVRQHARETALVAPSPELLSNVEKLGLHIHWRTTNPVAVVYVE